jgi:small subunit ribosomal protein S4
MVHPGYLLNPGDMFSVDVDTVMWATGRRKGQKGEETTAYTEAKQAVAEQEAEQENERNAAIETLNEEAATEEEAELVIEDEADDTSDIRERKASIKASQRIINDILEKVDLRPKQKQNLRNLRNQLKVLSRNVKSPESEAAISDFESNLESVLTTIDQSISGTESESSSLNATEESSEQKNSSTPFGDDHIATLAQMYSEVLPDKSYEQPWVPRDWMAPFAYVPRYLEVNYTICSAVYIRHPVARPGASEIPSPFNLETGSLAHNWYLRRR